MMFCTLKRDPPKTQLVVKGERVSFKTPWWDQDFLDAFKIAVPPNARRWDRDAKAWTMPVSYLDTLTELVRVAFHSEPEVVR